MINSAERDIRIVMYIFVKDKKRGEAVRFF